MDEQRSAAYDAVIPANVRYDDRLSANAKLLYGEIRALSNLKGYCYATNAYLSDQSRLGLTERSVQRLIKQLDELGYIYVRLLGKPVGNVAFGRRIYVNKSAVDLFDAETPTKLSGGDKIVGGTTTKLSGSTINNNNKIKEDARAKKSDDSDARSELTAWAVGYAPKSPDLVARLMDFCDVRKRKRKPLTSGRAVTGLTNKLVRYSDNCIQVMLRMLDESIERGWDSVYPLKPDVLREVLEDADAPTGEDGGDKWL